MQPPPTRQNAPSKESFRLVGKSFQRPVVKKSLRRKQGVRSAANAPGALAFVGY